MLLFEECLFKSAVLELSTQSTILNARNFWTIGNNAEDCWHKFEEKIFVKKTKKRFVIVFQKKRTKLLPQILWEYEQCWCLRTTKLSVVLEFSMAAEDFKVVEAQKWIFLDCLNRSACLFIKKTCEKSKSMTEMSRYFSQCIKKLWKIFQIQFERAAESNLR